MNGLIKIKHIDKISDVCFYIHTYVHIYIYIYIYIPVRLGVTFGNITPLNFFYQMCILANLLLLDYIFFL